MGCGGSKTREDDEEEPDTSDEVYAQNDNSHKITYGTAYNKDSKPDLSQNLNTFITSNTNYYKKQAPSSSNFSDTRFPPNNDSFFGKYEGNFVDPSEERRKKNTELCKLTENDIEWKHIKEVWKDSKIFNDEIKWDDVILGSHIPNAYFISVLNALSEFPLLVFQLFKTISLPDNNGSIEIGLNIDGDWKIVLLDDMIPVKKGTNEPIGANTKNNCLWGILLEKAWAKINGGYINICTGNPREVFETLTPFACIPIEIEKEDTKTFWKNIRDSDAYQCIMTCTTTNKEGLSEKGLKSDHTYCLRQAFQKTDKENKENTIKLLKLINPFGKGEWNGDWSDDSDKWNDENKEFFKFEKKSDDGLFHMTYEDFIKYFTNVCICVPFRPYKSCSFQIPKEDADNINVMKIKMEKGGIVNISLRVKDFHFHRKITPEQNVISNLILAKCKGKQFLYVNSSHNEVLSSELEKGEYVLLYHVDYKTQNIPPRKYRLNIGSSCDLKICSCNPDLTLDLLKSIMITKVETLSKYQDRFNLSIAMFTGNRFMNTAYGFFYIQNKGKKEAHIKTELTFENINSLEEGDVPPLKLNKYDTYMRVGNRIKLNEPFKAKAKCENSEESLSGEIQPELNSDNLKYYTKQSGYIVATNNFEFDQNDE